MTARDMLLPLTSGEGREEGTLSFPSWGSVVPLSCPGPGQDTGYPPPSHTPSSQTGPGTGL